MGFSYKEEIELLKRVNRQFEEIAPTKSAQNRNLSKAIHEVVNKSSAIVEQNHGGGFKKSR